MHEDVTKSTADKDLYEAELRDLAAQIEIASNTSFNGIDVFEITAGRIS